MNEFTIVTTIGRPVEGGLRRHPGRVPDSGMDAGTNGGPPD